LRKNKGDRSFQRLSVFYTYRIEGFNLDRLINGLKKEGITLYNLKKPNINRVYVTIKVKDCKKLFAITKDMCYNIKKIKVSGGGYPLLRLLKTPGLILGAVIFIFTAVFSNDLILNTSFEGSGAIYSQQVQEYLEDMGVKNFTRFSSVNLKSLGEGILASTDRLSFATCDKVGNTLRVNLVLSDKPVQSLTGDYESLVSPCDGEVLEIKAYRGTALFGVGDMVKTGDVVVGGYKLIGEVTVTESVVAVLKLKVEDSFIYRSKNDNEDSLAVLFACANIEGEVLSHTVEKVFEQGYYVYNVKLKMVKIISVG